MGKTFLKEMTTGIIRSNCLRLYMLHLVPVVDGEHGAEDKTTGVDGV